jgi:hypothetical protein
MTPFSKGPISFAGVMLAKQSAALPGLMSMAAKVLVPGSPPGWMAREPASGRMPNFRGLFYSRSAMVQNIADRSSGRRGVHDCSLLPVMSLSVRSSGSRTRTRKFIAICV